MKRTIPILLIIIFVLQSASSIILLLSFHIQREYIADNICINRFDKLSMCKGQCYLEKELTKEEEQKQKLPDLKPKQQLLFIENQEQYELQFIASILINTKQNIFFQTNPFLLEYINSIEHPPQVS